MGALPSPAMSLAPSNSVALPPVFWADVWIEQATATIRQDANIRDMDIREPRATRTG